MRVPNKCLNKFVKYKTKQQIKIISFSEFSSTIKAVFESEISNI